MHHIQIIDSTSSEKERHTAYTVIEEHCNSLRGYQYRNYPAMAPESWKQHFFQEVEECLKAQDCHTYLHHSNNALTLCSFKTSDWDYQAFGYQVAQSKLILSDHTDDTLNLQEFIKAVINDLTKKNVKLASIRLDGDLPHLINAFTCCGSSYYECIVWPTAKANTIPQMANSEDIVFGEARTESDLIRCQEIIVEHSFKRSHFAIDKSIPETIINKLYNKWVTTSFHSSDSLFCARIADEIAGFFIFGIDKSLSHNLGHTYGRLKFLALDKKYRGQKIGKSLFNRSLNYLIENGCTIIDSGYPTKNHVSARLHTLNNFLSTHEEVRLHHWL